MAHTVFCVKLKRELPGLTNLHSTRAGPKVYDNVSQEAWRMWTEHCKMLLNEYRLNPARREDQEVIVKQLEQFFLRRRFSRAQGVCATSSDVSARWPRLSVREPIKSHS